jgi:hypothetical protein
MPGEKGVDGMVRIHLANRAPRGGAQTLALLCQLLERRFRKSDAIPRAMQG